MRKLDYHPLSRAAPTSFSAGSATLPENERDLNRRNARLHRLWVQQRTSMLRNGYEEEYRALLGIQPDQHDRLLELLEENETTGEQRWSQIVEQVEAERGDGPAGEPMWSLLDRRRELPQGFRNMSHSRMMREFIAGQQRLIDQSQHGEYERIVGISTQHHQLLLDLLENAMLTGDSNFEEIREQIEAEDGRNHDRNGSGSPAAA